MNKRAYYIIIIIVLIVVSIKGISSFFTSDTAQKRTTMTSLTDSLATMTTDSVTMLISDSGIVRYKLLTKTWLVFDQIKEPYFFFPDKIYIEQFDSLFDVEGTIKADTAWGYTKTKIWRLKGNVEVHNSNGNQLTSEELYWDERTQKIYTNRYVHMLRRNKLGMEEGSEAEGGFISNMQMTDYVFTDVRNVDMYIVEDDDLEE